MKKMVLKLDLHDVKAKQEAIQTVSGLSGIDSISMDMKEKTLTVMGDFDPENVESELGKVWRTEIVSVVPTEEPEKKKEERKIENSSKMDRRFKIFSTEGAQE